MAIVARKRNKGTTFYVVFSWRGERIWENAGTDRRAAKRLETQRKAEVRDGTYSPVVAERVNVAVRDYAEHWGKGRKNRTANDDRQRLRDHVLSRDWFARMRMDDVRPKDVLKLVQEIEGGELEGKTVSNVYGALRTMFRDALFAEVIHRDPCALPKGTIKRTRKTEREPYTRREVAALLGPKVDPDRRVFSALGFYTGCREGEVCGLRFRNWDRDARPLGCLSVSAQYGGAALKTDNPRKVPVHPALAAMLRSWWAEGFELVYARKPKADDFIVPMRASPMNRHGVKPHHTKSSAYKLFRAAREQAGVANRTLHATRHTMITWARRGGARADVLERVTHNAAGTMVDQYTHFDWEPLCLAVLAIRFDVDAAVDVDPGSALVASSIVVEAPGIEAGAADAFQEIPSGSEEPPGPGDPPKASEFSRHGATVDARQRRRPVRALLRECVDIATGARRVSDPEAEVARRLRTVARVLPQTAPKRAKGVA